MATKKEVRWQHRRPKSLEECDASPIRPKPFMVYDMCAKCGSPIVKVDENEGPEALKALLRF